MRLMQAVLAAVFCVVSVHIFLTVVSTSYFVSTPSQTRNVRTTCHVPHKNHSNSQQLSQLNQLNDEQYQSTSEEPITEISDLNGGVRDSSGEFLSFPLLWKGDEWPPSTRASSNSICLAVHTSIERLYWLATHAKQWNGLVSVAIFAPFADIRIADNMVKYLKTCYTQVLESFSFSVVQIVYDEDVPDSLFNDADKLDSISCDDPIAANHYFFTQQQNSPKMRARYPQNLLRNLARRSCPTSYVLSADIDMIPSKGAASGLEEFLSIEKPCPTCAYIVPVYEIKERVPFPPNDKFTLLQLVADKKARFFHQEVYKKNQGNSDLARWESFPPMSKNIKVIYEVSTYEEYWEPIVILHTTAPDFEERFVGYGFTRSSHIYLLHRMQFVFKVLDPVFLSHQNFQTIDYPVYRKKQIENNRLQYQRYTREVRLRYQRKYKRKINKLSRTNTLIKRLFPMKGHF